MDKQQGDVKLFQTPDDGDISVSGGIVEMSGGLETMAYLCMFGGNFDDAGGADKTLSWWGNLLDTDDSLWYRSETQFLLKNIPATTGNLRRVELAALRDLAVFKSRKIANELNVVATIPGVNKIKLTVTINAIGQQSEFEFVENWPLTTVEPTAGVVSTDVPPPPPTIPLSDFGGGPFASSSILDPKYLARWSDDSTFIYGSSAIFAGALRMTVDQGVDKLYAKQQSLHPQLGDFTMEVKVEAVTFLASNSASQGALFRVHNNLDTYICQIYLYKIWADDNNKWSITVNNGSDNTVKTDLAQDFIWFRIKRISGTIYFYYSLNGVDWTDTLITKANADSVYPILLGAGDWTGGNLVLDWTSFKFLDGAGDDIEIPYP